jgi:hypothetical protein
VHINVAKDGRRERDNADGNQKEAHISDDCIVMARGGLRLLFWSKIVGAGGCARVAGAPLVARLQRIINQLTDSDADSAADGRVVYESEEYGLSVVKA